MKSKGVFFRGSSVGTSFGGIPGQKQNIAMRSFSSGEVYIWCQLLSGWFNSRPKLKGNQWVFRSPYHKGPRLFLGGVRGQGGGRLTCHYVVKWQVSSRDDTPTDLIGSFRFVFFF